MGQANGHANDIRASGVCLCVCVLRLIVLTNRW